MKVLITGQKGILGSAFVASCKDLYEIIGFDLLDGEDLLDYDQLKSKMAGAEQVVHLAAIPKPVVEKSFRDYFETNVRATLNVLEAAYENKVKRVIYASSTTIYGIERGIPFKTPITEEAPFVSQYLSAEKLATREADLSYHMSKVMAEQELAWYGLNKKIQTIALRFGPIGKVFLETSVSKENAVQAIQRSLDSEKEFWYEAFSIVDPEVAHISIEKAKKVLNYTPEKPQYAPENRH